MKIIASRRINFDSFSRDSPSPFPFCRITFCSTREEERSRNGLIGSSRGNKMTQGMCFCGSIIQFRVSIILLTSPFREGCASSKAAVDRGRDTLMTLHPCVSVQASAWNFRPKGLITLFLCESFEQRPSLLMQLFRQQPLKC